MALPTTTLIREEPRSIAAILFSNSCI
jgi:hypothetical protein